MSHRVPIFYPPSQKTTGSSADECEAGLRHAEVAHAAQALRVGHAGGYRAVALAAALGRRSQRLLWRRRLAAMAKRGWRRRICFGAVDPLKIDDIETRFLDQQQIIVD